MKVNQDVVREVLQKHLKEREEEDAKYSIRSFAQDLDINSGTLSQILSGKRRITEKTALKLADKLFLDEGTRERFLKPFELEKLLGKEKVYSTYEYEAFEAEHNWIVFGILNLIKIKKFVFTSKNIAELLGIEKETIDRIVNKMFEDGLIEWSDEGQIRRTKKNLSTPDKKNYFVWRSQMVNIHLAKEKLQNCPVEERDFSSMTLAFDSSKMDEARTMIRKFEDDFCNLFGSTDPDCVYKLNVQLYPISKKID